MSDASLAEIDDRLLMRRHVEGDAEALRATLAERIEPERDDD